MSRPKGSIIGAKPTWTTTATSGIWSLRQAEEMKAAGQWPRGPVAPTSLAGTAGDGQVALTWTAPATTHGTITDYVVQYSADSGVTWYTFAEGAAPPPQGWDISTAAFAQTLSVASQDTAPADITFSADGLKMYVVGATGQDINEYSLAIAWDVSTATYSQAFSVSGQDTQPQGVAFKSDGTHMYVAASENDAVYEYTLSTAWDISTATYSREKDVGAQETNPVSLAFSTDGTKMYVLGSVGDDVNQYTLATAWDVSTATYSQAFSVATEETTPQGLAFSADGTKMYVTGTAGDDINEYSLATAWDVSTATYTQAFSVASKDTAPYGVAFKSDGLKMYVVGSSSDSVHEYTLTAS